MSREPATTDRPPAFDAPAGGRPGRETLEAGRGGVIPILLRGCVD